jgi:hypothetical protein
MLKKLTVALAILFAFGSPSFAGGQHWHGGQGGWHSNNFGAHNGGGGHWGSNGIWIPLAIGGAMLGGAATCMRWSDEYQGYVNVCQGGFED